MTTAEWKAKKRAEGFCADFCGRKAARGGCRCEPCRVKHNARYCIGVPTERRSEIASMAAKARWKKWRESGSPRKAAVPSVKLPREVVETRHIDAMIRLSETAYRIGVSL